MGHVQANSSIKHLGDALVQLSTVEHGCPAITIFYHPIGMRPCSITELYPNSEGGHADAARCFEAMDLSEVERKIHEHQRFFFPSLACGW